MSDSLTRGFGAQLTTSMDAVLRRAVFEIMNIFENTVYDYRMEIAHKGEEVAQLKVKLQTAELKLKEKLCGNDGGQEIIKISSPIETPPTETPRQPIDVSEVDVDVPEDWCAPVGPETVTVRDVGVCPSIKLRQLSIPLWHIPIRKTEEGACDVGSDLETCRRSRRIPASDRQNVVPVEKALEPNQKVPLLRLKQESSDPAQVKELRRSRRKSAEEVNKQAIKKKKKAKGSATESRSAEVKTVGTKVENIHRCKICRKEFDTDYGQRVHARLHRKCWGCNKVFPTQKELILHRMSCSEFRNRLTVITTTPAKLPSECENRPTVSKTPTTVKRGSTPSSDGKLSTQTDASTKKYSCQECDKKCGNPYLLSQHMRVHLRKKLIPCSLCQLMCRSKRGMKIHKAKAHKDRVNSGDREDLTWTEPLEEIDDETQDPISIRTKSSQTSNKNNDEKTNSVLSLKWQTVGKDEQKRFTCLLCKKMFKDKYALIEHMGTHK